MRTEGEVKAEWTKANDIIDAAYWAFTRQARAKPPIMVCPQAYADRARLEKELREIRRAAREEVRNTVWYADGHARVTLGGDHTGCRVEHCKCCCITCIHANQTREEREEDKNLSAT